MEILVKPRGHGKTWSLIKRSLETGYPILVLNHYHKRNIQYMNNRVKVITLEELDRGVYRYDEIIIDEIEMILSKLLRKTIDMASYTGDITVKSEYFGKEEMKVELRTETTTETIRSYNKTINEEEVTVDSKTKQEVKITMNR